MKLFSSITLLLGEDENGGTIRAFPWIFHPYHFSHVKIIIFKTDEIWLFSGIFVDTHKERFLISGYRNTQICGSNMRRQANQQVPFGKLLTDARIEKNLSRAELARQTGIAENSLIRYEKAGLDKDGQYPPAQKLAKLCLHLELPSSKAIWSCLTTEDFVEYEGELFDDMMDHPHQLLMTEQMDYLERENQGLRESLRYFVDDIFGEEHPLNEVVRDWIRKSIRPVINGYLDYENRMVAMGIFVPFERRSFHSVGGQQPDRQWPFDRKNETFDPQEAASQLRTAGDVRSRSRKRLMDLLEVLNDTDRWAKAAEKEDPDQSPNSPGSSENK